LIVFYLIIIIYCLSIFYLAIRFVITKNDNYSQIKNYSVSILIPFKNEENNLKLLVNDIIKQDYPKEKIEIIFIDDNSTDKGSEIIKGFEKDYQNIKYLASQEQGKKNALKLGLKESKSEIIIHTDADVSLNKDWINTIVNSFIDEKILLSFGSVIFEHSSFFEKLQSLELISLSGIAASTGIIKHPVLISGANLAYRKNIKQDFIESINNIASGDDMFFLEKIKKKYPKSTKYIKDKNNIVRTKAEKNINSFIHQRIRWAGKTKKMKDLEIILSGIVSFIANISVIIVLVSAIWTNNLVLILTVVSFKFITELFVLTIYSKYFKQLKLINYFPILFIFYPFYIIIIGVLSMFVNPKWK